MLISRSFPAATAVAMLGNQACDSSTISPPCLAPLRDSTDVCFFLFVRLGPACPWRAATYARRCTTFCLRQLRQAARMLATLSAPISLGNTSLSRDDGTR
jgi:hypothetical protein